MYSTQFLDVPPLERLTGRVVLPGSKSISNRALLLAALCSGEITTLNGILESDDTRVMRQAIDQLGGRVEVISADVVRVTGLPETVPSSDPNGAPIDLFLGNAGTAMRPLVAALALRGGSYTLRGTPRMHERPIGDLVDALTPLGCRVSYLGQVGFPPLRIDAPAVDLSQAIAVRGDVSSQFLTGLLMALPQIASQDIHIDVIGELISKPYIDITLALLGQFGVVVRRQAWSRFTISAGSRYQSPGNFLVEADASSATYFIAAASMNPVINGQNDVKNDSYRDFDGLEVVGVGAGAIQGDIAFVDAACAMGANIALQTGSMRVRPGSWPLKAIDLDCNHIPDAAMTLAVMALYADGPSTLRNIASWRVKETDRIAAMATELRKLGAQVDEGRDWLRVHPLPREQFKAATIRTYDDHRMAMCLSLAAFNGRVPVRIEDPACVGKTFPQYFETLFDVATVNASAIPVLCIDGPTASGKGTLASLVAERLGYHYLDSGALYRATALAAIRAGVALDDEAAVAALASALAIRFDGAGAQTQVLLGGIDITDDLRAEATGMAASQVSAHPKVRHALVGLQLSLQKLPGLVADGRDMGTVIFPNAPLKVFLTASAQARAERRHKQLISKGNPAKIEDLRSDLEARDARDTQRSSAPLKPSADARHLDNSNLSIEESVQIVLDWWQQTRPF